LAARASKKLINEGLLAVVWAGSLLRRDLDRVPFWRSNHVSVKQLAEDFARYIYLPRLNDEEILLAAIPDGPSRFTWELEGFAYADSYDEATGRYRGLPAGDGQTVCVSDRLGGEAESPPLNLHRRRLPPLTYPIRVQGPRPLVLSEPVNSPQHRQG
jgi:hypothetical protein